MKIYYIQHSIEAKHFLGVSLNSTKQLRKVWCGSGPMKNAIRRRYRNSSLHEALVDLRFNNFAIYEVCLLTGQKRDVIDDWINQV